MVKKMIVCALCCVFLVSVLQGMNKSKHSPKIIRNADQLGDIVLARNEYRKNPKVVWEDMTRGNRIDHEPNVQQNAAKQATQKTHTYDQKINKGETL